MSLLNCNAIKNLAIFPENISKARDLHVSRNICLHFVVVQLLFWYQNILKWQHRFQRIDRIISAAESRRQFLQVIHKDRHSVSNKETAQCLKASVAKKGRKYTLRHNKRSGIVFAMSLTPVGLARNNSFPCVVGDVPPALSFLVGPELVSLGPTDLMQLHFPFIPPVPYQNLGFSFPGESEVDPESFKGYVGGWGVGRWMKSWANQTPLLENDWQVSIIRSQEEDHWALMCVGLWHWTPKTQLYDSHSPVPMTIPLSFPPLPSSLHFTG